MPNTAYANAKFAIRGFTEALIEDLRTNAPCVRVALVMPGHVGTNIIGNSRRAHGLPEPQEMSETQIRELIPADAPTALIRAGVLAHDPSADDLRQLVARMEVDFRDKAPLTAAEAAAIILEGVQSGAWRILVGELCAELVQHVERWCFGEAAGVAADQDMVEQDAHDGRLAKVTVGGVRREENLLLDAEVSFLFVLPVSEKRTSGVGRGFGGRTPEPASYHQRVMVVARQRDERWVALHIPSVPQRE
jgi:hypothetical protein